jgi:GT2 family glycosyltransferase
MVYFVIVTFNSSQFIKICIESISTYEPNAKIIVVDNNSQDDTLEIVKNYPGVLLLENKHNLGFGKANNIGILCALKNGADYVCLLNHDAYLVECVLDKVLKQFEQNSKIGILTPLQVQENTTALEENFSRFLSWDGILTEMVNDCFLRETDNVFYEVPFAQAASWIITKEAIKKTGLFNPLFFHYGEDNEYLNRLKYHGYKLGVITNCRIVHIANPLNTNHKKNFDQYHRNREYNKWLIGQLDLNINFSVKSWITSLLPYIKSLILSLLKLNLLRCSRLVKLLVRIIRVSFYIKSSRLQNSKTFKS